MKVILLLWSTSFWPRALAVLYLSLVISSFHHFISAISCFVGKSCQFPSSPTKYRLNNCQAIARQLTSNCHAVVRQLSGSCQAIVRQLSGSCQAVVSAVIRQSSSHQAVVRQSSGSCQAVVKQLSSSYQTVVRQLAMTCLFYFSSLKNAVNLPCSRSLEKLCLALFLSMFDFETCSLLA